MTASPRVNPDFDLTLTRIIRAPRAAVWRAWADPARFAQWWIPAPARCKVAAMDMSPGGAFVTQISEDGGAYGPHIDGCFLDVEADARDGRLTGVRVGGQSVIISEGHLIVP